MGDSLLRCFQRYQAVRIGQYSSDFSVVTSGIPQGSHLGPLLFNINVNDVIKCYKFSKFLMYADNLKMFQSVGNTLVQN